MLSFECRYDMVSIATICYNVVIMLLKVPWQYCFSDVIILVIVTLFSLSSLSYSYRNPNDTLLEARISMTTLIWLRIYLRRRERGMGGFSVSGGD